MQSLLIHGRLSPEDCRQMAGELGQLDATFPRLGPLLLSKLEYFGTWMLNEGSLEELRGLGCVPRGAKIEAGWREAFSRRLFLAAAFDRTDALVTGLLAADEGSAPDEAARRSKLAADLGDTGNWLFKSFARLERMPDSRPFRQLRSRLRLLRIAAHYRATGEILELDDPLGTKLFHKVEVDSLRVWGSGIDFNSEDIVLEIPLRP
jgi:hypothetical protein